MELADDALAAWIDEVRRTPPAPLDVAAGGTPASALWLACPNADLAGLPPTLLATAEHDPLRDEGEALMRRFGAMLARRPGALSRT